MSIHKIFAENLRSQCMRVGTIAEVCRTASVNRQQFNRYLSGAAIPNGGTLSRICKALKIEETELFMALGAPQNAANSNEQAGSEGRPDHAERPEKLVRKLLGSIDPYVVEGIRNRNNSPSEAIYYCYFPLQNFDQFLMRSVLSIRHVNGIAMFSRITRFKSPSEPTSNLAVGKHRGVVYTDDQQHNFIGVNRFAPYNVSLISIEQKHPSQDSVSIGLSLMRGSQGLFASRVCMEKLGNSFAIARRAMSRAGIVSLEDRSINPIVCSLFRQNSRGPGTQLGVPSLEETMIAVSA